MITYLSDRMYNFAEGTKIVEIACHSTDTKPTENIATGSICYEANTGKKYMFDEESGDWVEFQSGGGGGGGDLFSQVADILQSVSASQESGTFSSGAAEISIAPLTFDLQDHSYLCIDSITIEVSGQTQTLNNFDFSGEGATFEVLNLVVAPAFIFGDGGSPSIGLYVTDNTYERTDSITISASAFNIYTPKNEVITIFPKLENIF